MFRGSQKYNKEVYIARKCFGITILYKGRFECGQWKSRLKTK